MGHPAKGLGSGAYELENLWNKHHEVLRRAALGHSNKAIARDVGLSERAISYTLNSEIGRAKLAELQNGRDETVKTIREGIRETLPEALQVVREIMISQREKTKDSDRLKAALELMDRGGIVTKRVEDINVTKVHFDGADIERLKRVAKENGQIVVHSKKEAIDVPVTTD